MKPTWRKPVGVLGLIAALALYAVLVTTLLAPPPTWPALAQAVVYFVLGIIWLLPLRPLLVWMETGRWR